MARSLICGFEMGHLSEIESATAGCSIVTSPVYSGTYALRITSVSSAECATFRRRVAGGTYESVFQSYRFYLRIGTLPTAAGPAGLCDASGACGAYLYSDGKINAYNSSGGAMGSHKSTNTLSADGNWHLIEVDVGYNAGAGVAVYVDGSLWSADPAGAVAVADAVQLGSLYVGSTADLYFDDVILDDTTLSTSGRPGSGKMALLKPIADPALLDTWSGGAGGTTALYDAMNNTPPVGVASASGTNTSQIHCTDTNADKILEVTCQSYTEGGVSGTVQAVMAIMNHAEESATGTKTGKVHLETNPYQSLSILIDYGNDVGAAGTFPSGWKTAQGIVEVNPTVALGTRPTIHIQKSSTTSGVAVDFAGIYVAYNPTVKGPLPMFRPSWAV